MPAPSCSSGLRDNHSRGKAGDFLRDNIATGSELSFVSAYFTVHAYHALRDELEGGAFCTITGNVIHDIHAKRLFAGAEMGGRVHLENPNGAGKPLTKVWPAGR